jgi:hypothetical protein
MARFEHDEETTAESVRMYDRFGNTEAGHRVSWGQWDAFCFATHKSDIGWRIVQKFRKLVWKQRHIRIKCEGGLYFRTTQDMITEYPKWRLKKGWRQQSLVVRDIEALPTEHMSDHQRNITARVTENTRVSRRQTRRSINALKAGIKATSNGIPQRPILEPK